MTYTAAVAGASGYAGGELLRLVLGHPEMTLGGAAAGSRAGERVTAVHPQLPALSETVFADTDADTLAEADVVFLALPHGQSAALVADLPADRLVVDLGADFRLQDPSAWQQFYGSEHAGTWVYGMPELTGQRSAISSARRIANPGCYVTAVTLALAPVLGSGLVVGEDVVVVAASGTSGAGRGLKPTLLASEVMGSISAYKVGGTHQHTPEIEQNLSGVAGSEVTVSFTPLLAPMPRGILATCTAPAAPDTSVHDLRDALQHAYADEPFVHLLPEGTWPTTAATAGSNAVHLQVALDPRVGRAVVVAALDNLLKGAAGQAVQNANLALGLDEELGLSAAGVAP